jgi:2-oxoglutarate ferredoxin oxidoreductase subunit alpha
VRLSVDGRRPVYFYGRSGGNVPAPSEIVAAVKQRM